MLDRKNIGRIEFTDRELAEVEKIYGYTTIDYFNSVLKLFDAFYNQESRIYATGHKKYLAMVAISKIFLHGYIRGIREERAKRKIKYTK